MRYRTKPVEIDDARQYTGDIRTMDEFTNGKIVGDGGLFLETSEGYIPVLFNDWIIKTKDGHYACVKASLFSILYEPVPE